MRSRIVALTIALSAGASGGTIDDAAKAAGVKVDELPLVGVFSKTQDVLRDPRSLDVVDVFVYPGTTTSVGCMEYRAKNGLGGYNGSQYALWVFTDKAKLTFSPNSPSLWNTWCSSKNSTWPNKVPRPALIDKTSTAKYFAKRSAEQ